MQNFRTFQMAKELHVEIKKLKLKGELRDQLERASLSIATNLAEGSEKMGIKDRKRFFLIAMGSLRESQALLEIADLQALSGMADKVGASLYRLLQNPGEGML